MSDLSFRPDPVPLSIAALAIHLGVPVPAGANPDRMLHAVAALDRAGAADVVAFGVPYDLAELHDTRAGACLVAARHLEHVPAGTIALVTENPYDALVQIAALIHPRTGAGPAFDRKGTDPAAIVHREAALEQGVVIDPGVVIGPHAEIGAATTIGANSVIGPGVRIGRDCAIDAQVSIRCALIGDRVIIHAGARIGPDERGSEGGMPPLGRVVIQDDAVIGANAVVVRGRLGDTTIGDHARVGALAFVRPDTTLDRGETLAGTPFPTAEKMV